MQKSILITGCSSGIGYDAAHSLQKRGWRVLATCRNPDDVARLEGEGLESFVLDLADDQSTANGADQALARTNGQLTAVFNNGAFALPGASEDLSRDALRTVFETNFFGQFDLTNRLLPAMRKAGHGRVIFNSSVLGFFALSYRGAYNASKFAMEGMVDTMRLETLGADIHFILIEPGPIGTKIRQNAITPFERFIEPGASAHHKVYESKLIPRLYDDSGTPDPFQLDTSAVTAKLIKALEAKSPRPRYFVTTPTYMGYYMMKFLPTQSVDWLKRKMS